MNSHRSILAFLVLLFVTSWTSFAFSQAETATLSGRVTDQQGAILVGANVTASNVDTSLASKQKTNGSGLYVLSGLKPGRYRITVTYPGFLTINLTGVVMNVQDSISQNFKLAVGSVSESMTVRADEARVNTESAAVSTLIDQQFVKNTPLNGRSFQDLILLTPGVVTQSPQSQIAGTGVLGDFSVNGQRTESNYYMVDGVTGNTAPGGGAGVPQPASSGHVSGSTALGTTQTLISVDALQEFRVQSSTYSAEYGHGPGGQFSLVTRSGTNELHGSAFEYLRNDYLDANDWFNDHFGLPITPLRQNDFGATFGGPLRVPKIYNGKDKTFLFVSYEGLRLRQPLPATVQYVPSLQLRASAQGPALKSILNAYPLPSANRVDFGNGLAQFIKPFSLPSRINSTSIRIDHAFTPKLLMFLRYGNTSSSTGTRSLSAVGENLNTSETYTFGGSVQLSNAMLNEVRLGYSRGSSSSFAALDSFGGAQPINLGEVLGLGPSPASQVLFDVFIPGTGDSALQTSRAKNVGRQWNLVDTVSLSSGPHQVKLGIDYRRIDSPFVPTSPFALAAFFSEQSVLNNSTDLFPLGKVLGATPIFREFAAFGQDSYRIKHQLTLSFGVRWEVNPPPREAHGNDPLTLLGDINNPRTLTLAPRGASLWNTNWHDLAPRLGIAWTPHDSPGRTTVVRGGWGMFFDSANRVGANAFGGIGFQAARDVSGASVPLTAAELNFFPSTNPPYGLAYLFPRNLNSPYTFEWNASVEQQFSQAQGITVSYVGSSGRCLLQQQQRNIAAFNPNFSSIEYYPGGVTSSYQALQVEFQRRMSRGLQALGSYTWSHSIDFGSADSSQPFSRGNSDFDVRHSFSAGVSWDPAPAVANKAAAILFDHWGLDGRLSARTGFPITLLGNQIVNEGTGNTFRGSVDLVPETPVYFYGAQYPGGRAINPAAFALPVGNNPGNAPRNFLRGFGAVQMNVAIRRDFHLADKLKLQFRAEAFNVLNHPNFGLIDSSLSDATFGQAVQMLNQSLGTVNALYQQGGPRSMQLALKLLF